MSFRDLDLDAHYDSGKSDLLNEFYIPILSEASEYYRAVGFFNSKSLSLVARGLLFSQGSPKAPYTVYLLKMLNP